MEQEQNGLCCVINPLHECWKCGNKLCKQHCNREANDLFWCETCFDLDQDSFGVISRLEERLVDATESFDNVLDDLEEIVDHPSRCKVCKADEFCPDLLSLLDDADRRVRKNYYGKTF